MDEELDRAIDAALDRIRSAKPAPDFLPRVRAHLEQTPPSSPIRWWIPVTASASAVVAGVLVAALVHGPRLDGNMTVTTLPQRPAPVAQASALSPQTVVPTPARKRSNTTAGARIDRRAAGAEFDGAEAAVLVPPGQLAVIGRLLDAINTGNDDVASALRNMRGPAAIVIEPIQIEPVAVPPLKESM